MVWFDRRSHKVVVRAVYDGPGTAGKTTNLTQLAASFTGLRRGELFSPEARDGRTLYFDWLHVDGGVVQGHNVRCQFLTVPGQALLAHRRWHLVSGADVVVFVCDSTPAGVTDARRWLSMLLAHIDAAERSPPLVVQANKQDVPGALPAEEVLRALDLPPETPVVSARAAAGIGVRETAVLAVRAAANVAQQRILSAGIDSLPDAREDAAALLDQLRDVPSRYSRRRRRAPAAAAGPAPTAPPPAAVTAAPPAATPVRSAPLPPLPDAGVSGMLLWPAASGREQLRALRRTMDEGSVVREPHPGDVVRLRVGPFRLETSPRQRVSSLDEARARLLLVARTKTRLGPLRAPDALLACGEGDEGDVWLWTIERTAPSLRDALDALAAGGDEDALARGLVEYATAAATTIGVGIEQGVRLDASLARFAAQETGLVHAGEIADEPSETFAGALVEPLARYAGRDAAVEAYVGALATALLPRASAQDAVRTGLAGRSDAESAALLRALDVARAAPTARVGGGIEHE